MAFVQGLLCLQQGFLSVESGAILARQVKFYHVKDGLGPGFFGKDELP